MPFLHITLSNPSTNSDAVLDLQIQQEDGYYVIGEKGQRLWLRLRIRSDYPETYCRKLDDATIICGYGLQKPGETDEFLQISISPDGTIALQRDAYATLPLFFGASGNICSISNDYAAVYNDLPAVHLSHQGTLHALLPNTTQPCTIWEEIQLLGERHSLQITASAYTISTPPPRDWQLSRDAPRSDYSDFSRYFSDHLDRFTRSRLAGQYVAFEVSGGLDSATLPLYHARFGNTHALGIGMGSIIFPGRFEETQRSKLASITHFTGLLSYKIELDSLQRYPLTKALQSDQVPPFYCLDNIYAAPNRELIMFMAAQGVRVISTGYGGDEVFENITSLEKTMHYGKAEIKERQNTVYAPFYTEQFRQEYIAAVRDKAPYPTPYLSVTLLGCIPSLSNSYIEQDIWPVSPFIHPELYAFCQGLPAHFRANKHILRAFYKAYGLPTDIYNPEQNEHFGDFFVQALTSGVYDNIVQRLVRHAVTVRLGYVDPVAFLETYETSKQAAQPNDEHLLSLYFWLCFELNAQLHKKNSLHKSARRLIKLST